MGGTFSVAAHAVLSDSTWESVSIAVDSSLAAAVDVADGWQAGGAGVMIDDVFAGILGGLLLAVAVLWVGP